MDKDHKDPQEFDLTRPRLASYKLKWKRHQDKVYWVDIQLAPRKGLKFYQTRSNAIILYDTLPAYCISKAIVMKSEEIIYQMVYVSPKIIGCAIWILILLEAAKILNESNQNPIVKNGETRGWTRFHQGDREIYLVWSRGHQALNKNGETRGWIQIHPKLHVDAFKN